MVMFFLGSGRDMASTAGLPGLRRKRVISCGRWESTGWGGGEEEQPMHSFAGEQADDQAELRAGAASAQLPACRQLTRQMGGPLTGSSTKSFSGGRLVTSPPPPLLPPPRGDCWPEGAAAADGMLGVGGAAAPPAAGEAGAPSLASALSASPGRGDDAPDGPPLGAAPTASGDSGCGRSNMSWAKQVRQPVLQAWCQCKC